VLLAVVPLAVVLEELLPHAASIRAAAMQASVITIVRRWREDAVLLFGIIGF
jgi:hypothetical protein